MEPYMAVAIAGRVVSLTTFSAILVILYSQLRQDPLSRAFAGLVLIFAGNTCTSIFVRFLSLAGQDFTLLFSWIVVFAAAIPAMLLIFVLHYFEAMTPFRRKLVYFYLGYLLLNGVCAGLGLLNYHIHIRPDGILSFGRTPLANFLVGVGQGGLFAALFIIFQEYAKRPHLHRRQDRRVLLGVGILIFAGWTIAIPPLTQLTIEQFLYMLSSLVMVRPILRQRLFDPLTQLNAQLQARAEHLAAITRISGLANAHLSLSALLEAVVQSIQQQFAYTAVTLYLPEDNHLEAKATARKTSLSVRDLPTLPLPDSEHISLTEGRIVRIPLRAAGTDSARRADQRLMGLLEIQSAHHDPFEGNILSAFQILANQIAIAVRNVELFEQLQRSNQYKTRFIHTMSHELRTPLQTVVGTLSFLSQPSLYREVSLSQSYQQDLAAVDRAARHLHNLIDGILDLSRIESGHLELEIQEVSLVPILDEVRSTFSGALKPGVAFISAYPPALPPVLADDLRLKQIIGNLVSNACKFTHEGRIVLDAGVEGNFLRVTVTDTGPGIPPEAQTKLFASFTQASRFISREYGGTGLGLSISRQLARLQKGEVTFESVEGQGSTFCCLIPLASALNSQPQGDGRSHRISHRAVLLHPPSRQPLQVMVVGMTLDRHSYMDASFVRTTPYRAFSVDSPEQALALVGLVSPEIVIGAESVLDALKKLPVPSTCHFLYASPSQWTEVLQQHLNHSERI